MLPGDDVGRLILDGLISAELTLQPYDILIIAQKIVSKAENRFVFLDEVTPSARAQEVASEVDKDPRLVELILSESDEISRKRKGVLVVRHKQGFVSANAGIDRSNVPQEAGRERVLLLPVDPDGSAGCILATVKTQFDMPLGLIIADTHGRPHRMGTIGVAIGAAGLPTVIDKRGTIDRDGHVLQHTDIGIADEIAAAADMLMGAAAESTPVVVLRGLQLPEADGKAEDLFRPKEKDLYR